MADGFDIIGDVHGCADKLEELLDHLGYRVSHSSGVFRHKRRQALFVGDLIDRGPWQCRVLEIVKPMVDEGAAQMVMGNHEFNALAYDTELPGVPGVYLRPHEAKQAEQHHEFLVQLHEDERHHYLAWFRTLPLWLDVGPLRVVHACWHDPSLVTIARALGGNRFTSEAQLVEAATRSENPDSLYRAVDAVLKGPELPLAEYGAVPFKDKDGHVRANARIKWWRSHATKLAELAEIPAGSVTVDDRPYGDLPDVAVRPRDASFSYTGSVPVFYGHYWRTGQPDHLEDWTDLTACVDFSAVKEGTMVAYRWQGEAQIDWHHYHPHGSDVVRPVPSE